MINRTSQPQMLRLFVAVALSDAVRHKLAALQRDLNVRKLPMRWVSPGNIHLTLNFLGDTEPDNVNVLAAAMETAVKGHRAMQLEAVGCGVFPRLNNPRVLWVGLRGDIVPVTELKKALDRAFVESGVDVGKKEGRLFRPHLTLGRFRHKIAPQKVAGALQVMAQRPPIPFEVDRLHLFQSTLKPQGAVYTRLKTTQLAP